MVWVAGKQLQGNKYTIERILGHGRFGITYLARYKNDEPVVIKTPNDQSLNRPDFDRLQQVFVREAFKLARCRHPHIVKAEEPFQEDGLWCIPMEYIAGTTLADREQRILPQEEALRYIQQIGEALIEVHKHGLLHRDVRPENIMVRIGKAEAVLIDFGLALEFDHEMTKTRTEEIAEGFAPLELYSRQAERGAYTDIYSLGATLYVLLTGQKPAGAMKRKLDNERLIAPKESNPQISNRINRAILSAMELEAEKRPQSVQDWLDSLGLKNDSVSPNQSPNPRENRDSRRRIETWQLIIAAVAAIGALLAGIAPFVPIFQNRGNSGSSPPPTSTP